MQQEALSEIDLERQENFKKRDALIIFYRIIKDETLWDKVNNSGDAQEVVSFEGKEYTLYNLRGMIRDNLNEYGEDVPSFGPGFNEFFDQYPPLTPTKASIRKVELDPNRNPGATITKSKSFLKDAKDFAGGKEEVPEIKPEWITGLDLFNMMSEKVPTLVGDVIPQEGLVALVGSSDTGKSMMLRQLAVNIVRDTHFLNFPIHARHKSVAIISTEDDSKSLAFLIRRQSEGRSDGLENIHVFFESEGIVEELDIFLSETPVDAVIADAWGDLFSGNQVDSGQIRQTLNKYKALANKYGCVIIFLHHTGKRTQKLSPSKDNILSGQGFEAKMRLVLELRNDQEDPDYRHLCVVKGNYLGKEYKNASYKVLMDETSFLFTDTGDRVSFDDLSSVTDSGKEKKAPVKRADEVDILTHIGNVKEIFKDGELHLKGSELKSRISDIYAKNFGTGFGSDRVQKYYTYLTKDVKLIGKDGKDKSPNAYYFQDC